MTIGLTGSFCSGKTTVANILRSKGIVVIDSDEVYSSLLDSDSQLRKKLVKFWGRGILKKGKIDKMALSERVFEHPQGLRKISLMTHKHIIAALRKIHSRFRKKNMIVVFEVPLLFESGLERLFDITVLVWAPKYVLLKRAKGRGYKKGDILEILAQQMPANKKMRLADYVIKNNGSRRELKNRVDNFYREIIKS